MRILKKYPQFRNAQRSSDIIVYFVLLEMMRINQYGSPEPRLVNKKTILKHLAKFLNFVFTKINNIQFREIFRELPISRTRVELCCKQRKQRDQS